MHSIDEVKEVTFEAGRRYRRCLVAVLLSAILTCQVALGVILPEEPVLSAQLFAAALFLLFLAALAWWYWLQSLLGGLELSCWPLHKPATVEPRPVQTLEEYRPLPRWLVPRADYPAPSVLAEAVAETIRGSADLEMKCRECVAARDVLTVYDAVNLLFAARALARAGAL